MRLSMFGAVGALAGALAMSFPAAAGVNCLDYLAADREFQQARHAVAPIHDAVVEAFEVNDQAALKAIAQLDGGRWKLFIQARRVFRQQIEESKRINLLVQELIETAQTQEDFATIRSLMAEGEIDWHRMIARVDAVWMVSWGYDETAERLALAYIDAYIANGGNIGDHRLIEVFRVAAQERLTFCPPDADPLFIEPLELLAKAPPRFEVLNRRAEANR